MTRPTAQVLLGDALEILPTLPAHHYQVAIADPPYIIGGSSIASPASKSGTWADMVNAATWYRTWMDELAKRLRPDAWLLLFGNWRSLPTYLCAVARSRLFVPHSCMVWDKTWIGPGGPCQLRPRWELILWCGMPEARIADRGTPDVLRLKWQAHMGRSGHPAEKPVPLLARLLQIAAPAGGHVLDPFAGRASAGIAALTHGYPYTGIESDPHHHAAAVKRLAEPVARELLPGAVGSGSEAAAAPSERPTAATHRPPPGATPRELPDGGPATGAPMPLELPMTEGAS